MTTRRKMIVLTTVAVLTLLVTPAVADEAREKYEEKFESTEKLSRDGKVYLSNIAGNIKILTWDRAEVKIDALKTSSAKSLEKAKENAALVRIEVSRRGDQLEIRTKYPERRVKRTLSVSVEYTLTIPDRAEATVNNVSGNIDAEDVGGMAKLKTVSGNVGVAGAAEGGVFSAVSGNVNLRDVGGDVNAETVSGKISLESVSGTVDAQSVSGSVDIRDLSDARAADINVHSGRIVFEGVLNPDGRYSFSTHSGSITIYLPEDAAFDFNFQTFSGNISSEFEVLAKLKGKLKHPRRDVRGQVNDGGADLTVKTFSGDVRLKQSD